MIWPGYHHRISKNPSAICFEQNGMCTLNLSLLVETAGLI